LFLGVDWKRKGGEIAFDSMVALERAGIRASLTVCGCQPPASYFHSKMKVIPFLDKNNSNDRGKLIDLLLNSDFLLLPTRSEAYGIVFCEANAFGLPVIATDTGGVSEIVKNGYNGFLLSPNAEASDYARIIMQIWNDEVRYLELVENSRKSYDQRLNWDAWGKAVKKAIGKIS
jgi:glycosyltransferase involved in cell wall biosynthesis